jgi:transcriptional regulator with XRE-family HTH domain
MTDADRLRAELARLGLSQAALARRLGLTPRHLSRYIE